MSYDIDGLEARINRLRTMLNYFTNQQHTDDLSPSDANELPGIIDSLRHRIENRENELCAQKEELKRRQM